jgi:hypothetical protein
MVPSCSLNLLNQPMKLVNGTHVSPFPNFVPSQEENDINEFLYGMYFHEYNGGHYTKYGRQHDEQYRHDVMIPDNIVRLLNERELKNNEKDRKKINKSLHEEIMKLIKSKNMPDLDRFSKIQHKNTFRSGTIYHDSPESKEQNEIYYKYLIYLKNEKRSVNRSENIYDKKSGGKRRKTRRQNKRKRRCTTKKRVRWAR